MKRLSALHLAFLVMAITGTALGQGIDCMPGRCIPGFSERCAAADPALFANARWMRHCTGPHLFNADSQTCRNWALRRTKGGMGANICEEMAENAKTVELYLCCMRGRGYSLIASTPLSTTCRACPFYHKYSLDYEGFRGVVSTVPADLALPQWWNCPGCR